MTTDYIQSLEDQNEALKQKLASAEKFIKFCEPGWHQDTKVQSTMYFGGLHYVIVWLQYSPSSQLQWNCTFINFMSFNKDFQTKESAMAYVEEIYGNMKRVAGV